MLRPLIARLTSAPEAFYEIATGLIEEGHRSYRTRLEMMDAAGRDINKFKAIIERKSGKKYNYSPETGFVEVTEEVAPTTTEWTTDPRSGLEYKIIQ